MFRYFEKLSLELPVLIDACISIPQVFITPNFFKQFIALWPYKLQVNLH